MYTKEFVTPKLLADLQECMERDVGRCVDIFLRETRRDDRAGALRSLKKLGQQNTPRMSNIYAVQRIIREMNSTAEVIPLSPRADSLIPAGTREKLMYHYRMEALAVRGKPIQGYTKVKAGIIPQTFGAVAPLKEGSTWGELQDWIENYYYPTIVRAKGARFRGTRATRTT